MNKKILTLILVALFAFFLRLYNLHDMGRTWDEHVYADEGYKMVTLIKEGNLNDPFWTEIKNLDHPPLAKYFYGLLAGRDLAGEYNLILDEHEFNYDFNYTRVISIIFGVGTTVLLVLLGWQFFSPLVGILAGIIFTTIPLPLGLSQLVTIESPLLFFFTLAIYGFLYGSRNKSGMTLAGIALGLALSIKFTNLILLPLFLLTFPKWKLLKIFAIAIVIFVLLWPALWFEPGVVVERILEDRFKEGVPPTELFMGEIGPVPIYYYLVYLLVSIPLLYLILGVLGVVRGVREKGVFWVILLWFSLPFLQSFYTLRQNGLRYIIEILPAFSLITALGVEWVVSSLRKQGSIKIISKWIPAFAGMTIIIYGLLTIVSSSPYYLSYYNELGLGSKFEQGWWGEGHKEAMEYLEKNAPEGSTVALQLFPRHTFPISNKFKYQVYSPDTKADYVMVSKLSTIREGFDESYLEKDYQLIYSKLVNIWAN